MKPMRLADRYPLLNDLRANLVLHLPLKEQFNLRLYKPWLEVVLFGATRLFVPVRQNLTLLAKNSYGGDYFRVIIMLQIPSIDAEIVCCFVGNLLIWCTV